MFSRKPRTGSVTPPKPGKAGPSALSFIGPEVVISGDLTTSSQLHVDGRIDGHVRCAQLCQGASGIIAGDIVADEARIAGLVQGTVNAATVIVEASGRVTGDVSYDTISIAAGAQIDGRLARRQALGQSAPPVLIATSAETAPAEPAAKGSELFPRDEKRAAIA
jgi:cytoskeletal protein CcmA (bactofilin family)